MKGRGISQTHELPAVLVFLRSFRPVRMDEGINIGCICSLRPGFRDESDNRFFAGAQKDRQDHRTVSFETLGFGLGPKKGRPFVASLSRS